MAPSSQTLADQAPALQALHHLATTHPDLPDLYISIHAGRATVQADQTDHFESWRQALDIPEEAVELQGTDTASWLRAVGEVAGVCVVLTAHLAVPVGVTA